MSVTLLSCRGHGCLAIPTAFPNPFAFPAPSYHISSSPILSTFPGSVAPSAAVSLAVTNDGPSCTPGWRYPCLLDLMFPLSHKSQALAPISLCPLLLPVAAADKKCLLGWQSVSFMLGWCTKHLSWATYFCVFLPARFFLSLLPSLLLSVGPLCIFNITTVKVL